LSGIPRSTYYYFFKKEKKDNLFDIENIQKVFEENYGRYGYRRMTIVLNKLPEYKNNPINHKKVLRLMRLLGLKCKSSNVSRYNSYKGQVGKTVPNLLITKQIDEIKHITYYKRTFVADKPHQIICSDITEFKLGNEKLYLSPVIDLYNGEIIAYDLSDSPGMNQIRKMMSQVFKIVGKDDGTIFHTDQGWQYQQSSFQKSLKDHNINQSMSRKGNCLDNSVMENFFGRMKTEMFYGLKYDSLEELTESIHDYIYYYNNIRIKTKLKGLSPVEYRTQSFDYGVV